eukprot:2899074-Amphidinium_carterae.4
MPCDLKWGIVCVAVARRQVRIAWWKSMARQHNLQQLVGRALQHFKFVPQQVLVARDKVWAAYQEGLEDENLAWGDKCESCWKAWKGLLPGTTWEQMCDLSNHDLSFKQLLDETKGRQAERKPTLPGPKVACCKSVQVEVTRRYLGATERDLKQALSTQRLTKSATKGLVSINVPQESGQGSEQLYLFAHLDSNALREVSIKSVIEVGTDQTVLDHDKSQCKGHDAWVMQHWVKAEGYQY